MGDDCTAVSKSFLYLSQFSSVSPVLYYTEEDTTLYTWKYTGTEYAARNIITNGASNSANVVGIYYKDTKGDFNIYTEQKKNYTTVTDYNSTNKTISCYWVDSKTQDGKTQRGIDHFILDDSLYDGYSITKDEKGNIINKTKNNEGIIDKAEDTDNQNKQNYSIEEIAEVCMPSIVSITIRRDSFPLTISVIFLQKM